MSEEIKRKIKVVEIRDEKTLEMVKPAVLLALREIDERSGKDCPAEKVFEYIRDAQLMHAGFSLFLTVDMAKIEAKETPMDCVCGLLTIQLNEGECGKRIAFISRGWIRSGYHGEPFDAILPTLLKWKADNECHSIVTMTERSTEAYERWIGKRGFKRRVTMFQRST